MGLDQYAYAAARAGQYNDFWQGAERDGTTGDYVNPQVARPQELAYWRKHPNLQGWMRRLWESRGNTGSFNGDELELTWQDLDNLERAITHRQLPATTGFFFGDMSDDEYREHDLEFVRRARAELFMGLRVFYNSSW